MTITVHDNTGLVYEGEATALSSVNSTGPFDILEEHTHFISLIEQSLIIYTSEGKTIERDIGTGVIQCKNGVIRVVLGIVPH